MKMKCKVQAYEYVWTPTPFWTWNMDIVGVDMSIDCRKTYKTEAGALKAAHRFAVKYGIQLEE